MTKKDETVVMPSVTEMLTAAQNVRDAVRKLNMALSAAHSMKIKASVVRDTDVKSYDYTSLPAKANAPAFKVKSMVIDL